MVTNAKPRYWTGTVNTKDDFRQPILDSFIDGKTRQGPWAIMTPASWELYGVGRLGPGTGQRYVRQPDAKWKKVEG